MDTNISTLDSGLALLKELGIHRYYFINKRYEIRHEFDNQAIISYGSTLKECVINFHELYVEFCNKELNL